MQAAEGVLPQGGKEYPRRRENQHRAAEGVRASRGNPWLEIDIDPRRLVIGAGRTGIDPGGAHARRERGRNKAVVDALARRERRAFVFAVPGSMPVRPAPITSRCGSISI